jgi:hypothetical protein
MRFPLVIGECPVKIAAYRKENLEHINAAVSELS